MLSVGVCVLRDALLVFYTVVFSGWVVFWGFGLVGLGRVYGLGWDWIE